MTATAKEQQQETQQKPSDYELKIKAIEIAESSNEGNVVNIEKVLQDAQKVYEYLKS